MDLQYSLNPDVQEATRKLLQNNSWVDPSKLYLETARALASFGFIELKEHYFIKCAYDLDLDYLQAIDPDCNNDIPISENFDESCDDLSCENCGRYILPVTYRKKKFFIMALQLNIARITHWFEESLKGYKWAKLSEGTYCIILASGLVNIILPDFVKDPSYLSIDKLRSTPTAFITLRNVDVPVDIFIKPMADLVLQAISMSEVIEQVQKRGVPQSIPNTCQVLPLILLRKSKIEQDPERLTFSITSDEVYLNDIMIINKQAKSRFSIFKVLYEQYCEAPHLLSLNQISEKLELLLGKEIVDLEQLIRRPINKMQKNIVEIFAKQLGINIDRNDVIQSIGGWPGLTKRDSGYRLNPDRLQFKRR